MKITFLVLSVSVEREKRSSYLYKCTTSKLGVYEKSNFLGSGKCLRHLTTKAGIKRWIGQFGFRSVYPVAGMAFTPATGQLSDAGFSNVAHSQAPPDQKGGNELLLLMHFPWTECNLRLVITNQTLHKFRHRVWLASPPPRNGELFVFALVFGQDCLFVFGFGLFRQLPTGPKPKTQPTQPKPDPDPEPNSQIAAELQRLLFGNGFCFVNLLGPTTQPAAWATFMECALLRIDLDYSTGRRGCGMLDLGRGNWVVVNGKWGHRQITKLLSKNGHSR